MVKSDIIKIYDLIPDKPLTDPSEDKFGREHFAKRVAEVLINKQTPDHLTVGLYGKWGEGKTTVINFIKYYLDNEYKDQVIYLDFNPWRYQNEDQLLNSFFKQFAQGVSHKLTEGGTEIAKTLLAYSGLIVAIAEPVTGLAMFANLGGWEKFKTIFSKGKDFVNNNDFSTAINSLETSLKNSATIEKQKNRISNQLELSNRKYIIFIDDIDRLDKREIQILFSLIKVTADFDNVIYVLSFDPRLVSTALGEIYSEPGVSFLEKIVQVPLDLPKCRRTDVFNEVLYPGIKSILESFAFEVSNDEMTMIADSIRNGLESRLDTPRLVKRYLNSINFALPILRSESFLHDVIMVEGLRICYPDVYKYVFQNRELFITHSSDGYKPEEVENNERQKLHDYLKDKDESLNNLLTSIFPRLNHVYNHLILNDGHSYKQRVSSPEYFERYFTYSIPKNDLSDSSFTEFIIGLTSNDIELSTNKAVELIRISNADTFLRKIEYRLESIDDFPVMLIIVLARLGKYFTENMNLININTHIRRVSFIIKELIKRLPEENRIDIAQKVLNQSTNIMLTAEIGRHLHKNANKEPLFSDNEHQLLVRLVAEHIKEDAVKNGPFYMRNDIKMNSPLLFNLWTYHLKEEDVQSYIIQSFNNKSSNVLEFLKSFTPLRGVGENETYQYGLFEADEYTKVKRLVSPQILYKILMEDYSSIMTNIEMMDLNSINDLFFEGNLDEGLVKKFAYFYHRDKDFKKSK